MCIRPFSTIIDAFLSAMKVDKVIHLLMTHNYICLLLLHSMQPCISDIKSWATSNVLKSNESKAGLMLYYIYMIYIYIYIYVIYIYICYIYYKALSISIAYLLRLVLPKFFFKASVITFGFTLECHLTINDHFSIITQTCYFKLHYIASICRFLTNTATSTLVFASVLSTVDYCNSLLFGSSHDLTSHLQQIQNYATKVILRLPKSFNITTHFNSLHWLPVKVRKTYKIACFCYFCHNSTIPLYTTDIERAITLPQHSLQLLHHASSQWTCTQ